MSGAYTPGTVQTAPYGWTNLTSVQPASPYTPQPDCKSVVFINSLMLQRFLIQFSCESTVRTYYYGCSCRTT